MQRSLVRISTVSRPEAGDSASSGTDLRGTLQRTPLSRMPVEHLTPAIEARAVEVQLLRADLGHHLGPPVPDLLIAVTTELIGLTMLHTHNNDFELIASPSNAWP